MNGIRCGQIGVKSITFNILSFNKHSVSERVCVCDFINGLSQSYFIGILNYAMNLLPHIICLAYFRSRIAGNGATYVPVCVTIVKRIY